MSSRKNKVSYVKPPEPKFIQEIKKRVGYREAPTLTDKLLDENHLTETDKQTGQEVDKSDTILDILDSDLVSVVQSKDGDLSLEEAKEHLKNETTKQSQHEESAKVVDETPIHGNPTILPYDESKDGKIIYKKPEKKPVNNKRSSASTLSSSNDEMARVDSSAPASKKKKALLCMSYSDEEHNDSD